MLCCNIKWPARDYIQMGGWRVLYYSTVGLCRQGQPETTSRWVGGVESVVLQHCWFVQTGPARDYIQMGGGVGECCTTTLLVCADRASQRLHPDGGGGECCTTTLLVCADRASQRLHPDGGGGGGECCTTTLLVCADRASQRLHPDGWGVWRVLYYNTVGLCRQGQPETTSRWVGGGGGGGWRVLYYNTVGLCRQGQPETTSRWGGGGVESVVLQHCWFVQTGPARDYIQMGGGCGECCTTTLLVCADRASQRLHPDGGWRVLYYNTVGLCRQGQPETTSRWVGCVESVVLQHCWFVQIGPARDYIQMLCENVNLKFLVFAYHHSMMDGLQQTLWDKKVKFVRIDGHTRPSDRQVR